MWTIYIREISGTIWHSCTAINITIWNAHQAMRGLGKCAESSMKRVPFQYEYNSSPLFVSVASRRHFKLSTISQSITRDRRKLAPLPGFGILFEYPWYLIRYHFMILGSSFPFRILYFFEGFKFQPGWCGYAWRESRTFSLSHFYSGFFSQTQHRNERIGNLYWLLVDTVPFQFHSFFPSLSLSEYLLVKKYHFRE